MCIQRVKPLFTGIPQITTLLRQLQVPWDVCHVHVQGSVREMKSHNRKLLQILPNFLYIITSVKSKSSCVSNLHTQLFQLPSTNWVTEQTGERN